MSLDYLPQPNDTYKEDVSTILAGSVLVGQPCQVWKISVKVDVAGAAVVNFSDDTAAYTTAHRKDKAVLNSSQTTVELNYPHGLFCSRGLCATSNVAGVDIFVSYD